MAIVSMRKLSICANKKHRKAILETLQSMGIMEFISEDTTEDGLEKMDTQAARTQYERSAEAFDRVLKLLAAYAPENKGLLASFEGRKEVAGEDFKKVAEAATRYLAEASELLKLDREIQEREGQILKDRNQIEGLKPWIELGIPMDSTGTKTTETFIGTLPDALPPDKLYAAASAGLPEPVCLTADILSTSNEMTCISVLCLKRDRDAVEANLRSIGYARPSQPVSAVPKEAVAELEEDIASQTNAISELKKRIGEYAGHRGEYRIAADYFRTRAEKYRILGTIPQSKNVFFIEGWIPADQADRVSQLLANKYEALVEQEEIRADDVQPTILRNNQFSQAAEGVLASYGLPQHGRVDPTFIMSIFYVIFFGMMLSDAGYGILMFVACAVVLKKFPKMAAGTKKMLQLFFWCGLSTAFWGFMYGGFFGDAIDVVATTFFGYTGEASILKPLWFEPLKNPMRLLVWCMLFGVIHLFFGLGIKGYEILKEKDIIGFISDIVAWYAFLIGLIFMLLPSDIFKSISGMEFSFPAFVAPLSKGLALGGMLVILVMSGRSRKNWALRIALGAYDIYGVTSWLSDVLSYSRLLALGLATGVIGNVINMMASMFGGGVVGAILFIIIFILGHTLNIGINALGAYVHTNRLQYVEFFGKFYDGGGKPFVPFTTANHYIEIKEEK